jgi:hypothetical protein
VQPLLDVQLTVSVHQVMRLLLSPPRSRLAVAVAVAVRLQMLVALPVLARAAMSTLQALLVQQVT